MEIKNAIIKTASLGPEGHGILSGMIMVEYDGCINQGFGGYDLRHSDRCSLFVNGCLSAAGAESWSRLNGMLIRIKIDGVKIVAIGHIIDDKWFTREEMEKG